MQSLNASALRRTDNRAILDHMLLFTVKFLSALILSIYVILE